MDGNGILQTPYHWTGNLPDDFMNTAIYLGSYNPRLSGFDTLVVWVSNPNGEYDSTYFDDTLSIITFGCVGSLSGDYIIGTNPGADYASCKEAINVITTCGANGDITFKLQSGEYEPMAFGDLSAYMGNYTLTITSLADHADSVCINRTHGNYSLNLDGVKNMIVKKVTVLDTATTSTTNYGIMIVNNVRNLEIRDCKIIVDTLQSSSTYHSAIYKTSTGVLDNVRIINNYIAGDIMDFICMRQYY